MPYICLNTFCIILSKKKINIFLYAIGINMYVYRIHHNIILTLLE